MTENTTDILGAELRRGLRKVLAKTMVLRGAVGILSFVAVAGWLSLIAVLWVVLSRDLSLAHALVFSRAIAGLLGLAFVILVIVPLVRVPSLKTLASELERRRDFQDLVAAGYEFSESGEAMDHYSPELIREVIRRAIQSIEGLQVRFLFITRRQLVLVPVSYTALLLLFVWAAVSPTALIRTAGYVVNPRETARIEREANLFCTPGNTTVLAGSDVDVVARDFGGSVDPVTVSYTLSNGFWKTEGTSTREAAGVREAREASAARDNGSGDENPADEHVYTFKDVRGDISYYVARGRNRTPTYTIRVVHKPVVSDLVLVLTPPRYTGEPPDTLVDSGGNVSALEGTRVDVSGGANNVLAEAALVFDGKDKTPARTDGRRFNAEFTAVKDGTYTVSLKDTLGYETEDPVVYTIDVFDDRPPVIDVLKPGDDALLPKNSIVGLGFTAADDYGVQEAAVFYRKGADGPFEKTPIPLGQYAGQKELLVGYDWSLEGMTLFPGDYVEYYVEVKDNNVVTGPGVAKSPVFRIEVPTMAELYDRAQGQSEKRTDIVQEALKEGQDLKERVEKLSQEMKKTEGVDWSQQKEIDKAIASQEKIQDLLKDMQKSLDETLQSLSDNRMTSEEIGKKLEEINRLIEEINSDALNKYIEQMREAMAKLDPEKIRQAMENMNLSTKDLLKSLERTASLLKEIQREQNMEELVRKTKDLLEAQEALSDSTSRANDREAMDALAGEQQKLAEQASELEKELADSSQALNDKELAEKLQQASEKNSMSEASKEMKEAASQLKTGNKDQAGGHQAKAMESLIGLFKDLASMQMEMQAGASNRLAANLQRLATSTLEISFKQEDLTDRMRQRAPTDGDPAAAPAVLRELAEEQQRYARAVGQIADELFELSKQSPMVPERLLQGLGSCRQNMENSLLFLEQNRPFISATNASQATTALNQITMDLLRTCNNCSGGGAGQSQPSALLQSLLSGQQQVLKETEQLLALSATQERLRQEMQADVERVLGQQRSLRDIAEKIQKDLKQNERVLGRMDKITEEMDEVIKDFDSGDLGDHTLRKQERILSRLLDAQRSVHSRDYEKERISKTAADVFSETPGATSVHPASQLLREEIRRAMALKAPGEFEDLIRLYFRALAEETQTGPEKE